eukprot:4444412-Pyramimonas_sp.AAC.1
MLGARNHAVVGDQRQHLICHASLIRVITLDRHCKLPASALMWFPQLSMQGGVIICVLVGRMEARALE